MIHFVQGHVAVAVHWIMAIFVSLRMRHYHKIYNIISIRPFVQDLYA